jgi:hypothetical protein
LQPSPTCEQIERTAEDAAAGEESDQQHQEPEPELPVRRIDAREEILQQHEQHGANERAIQMTGAAEHQHDEPARGALEAQNLEPDELVVCAARAPASPASAAPKV